MILSPGESERRAPKREMEGTPLSEDLPFPENLPATRGISEDFVRPEIPERRIVDCSRYRLSPAARNEQALMW
jgi:hypothetical protein